MLQHVCGSFWEPGCVFPHLEELGGVSSYCCHAVYVRTMDPGLNPCHSRLSPQMSAAVTDASYHIQLWVGSSGIEPRS